MNCSHYSDGSQPVVFSSSRICIIIEAIIYFAVSAYYSWHKSKSQSCFLFRVSDAIFELCTIINVTLCFVGFEVFTATTMKNSVF
jgi:hypothetical protein